MTAPVQMGCATLRAIAEGDMAKTMNFGYDGDGGLGDRVLATVLRGDKTATSSLAIEYLSGDPLPRVGEHLTLVNHNGRPHVVVKPNRLSCTGSEHHSADGGGQLH